MSSSSSCLVFFFFPQGKKKIFFPWGKIFSFYQNKPENGSFCPLPSLMPRETKYALQKHRTQILNSSLTRYHSPNVIKRKFNRDMFLIDNNQPFIPGPCKKKSNLICWRIVVLKNQQNLIIGNYCQLSQDYKNCSQDKVEFCRENRLDAT